MASMPSKLDIVKAKTYDFLQNERLCGELVQEKDFGNNTSHENGQARPHHQSVSNEKEDQLEEKLVEEPESSRSSKKKKTKISIITDSSTDFSGSAPKRYTTTCYIQPMNVPYRYSETIFLKIETKKRSHKEKIFFKDEMIPIRWAETMSTEITTFPKNIMSEITIPVEDVFIELNPAA
nr:uncharacterized protein LOC111501947 isoform X2 [Leptinotarsa decemlineata]